jgi:hypothetical protein
MSADLDDQYEALRHFIINGQSPGYAGLMLRSFEEDANAGVGGGGDAKVVEYARDLLEAVRNPGPKATDEQREFCRLAIEAKEKFRAIEDAGWKTPLDEGREAFDLNRELEGRPAKPNPYTKGSYEYDWWQQGMSLAFDQAFDEGKMPETEEEKRSAELPHETLEALRIRHLDLAKQQRFQFLAVFSLGMGEHLICFQLLMLLHHFPAFPADLRERLESLLAAKSEEVGDHELERTISLREKIEGFNRFVDDVQAIFVELGERNVDSPIGILRGDPLLIASTLHEHQRQRLLKMERSQPGPRRRRPKNRRSGKNRKRR